MYQDKELFAQAVDYVKCGKLEILQEMTTVLTLICGTLVPQWQIKWQKLKLCDWSLQVW